MVTSNSTLCTFSRLVAIDPGVEHRRSDDRNCLVGGDFSALTGGYARTQQRRFTNCLHKTLVWSPSPTGWCDLVAPCFGARHRSHQVYVAVPPRADLATGYNGAGRHRECCGREALWWPQGDDRRAVRGAGGGRRDGRRPVLAEVAAPTATSSSVSSVVAPPTINAVDPPVTAAAAKITPLPVKSGKPPTPAGVAKILAPALANPAWRSTPVR